MTFQWPEKLDETKIDLRDTLYLTRAGSRLNLYYFPFQIQATGGAQTSGPLPVKKSKTFVRA